jgi:hypothetical protein
MLLPTTGLDHPLWTNARLFLAIATAALIPFTTIRKLPTPTQPSPIPRQPDSYRQSAPLSRLV